MIQEPNVTMFNEVDTRIPRLDLARKGKPMNKRQRKIWNRLKKHGWKQVDDETLAMGKLTFAFVDKSAIEGGAILSHYVSPYRPGVDDFDDEEQPDLVGYYDIWINHPRPVRCVLGDMKISTVLSQISASVIDAICRTPRSQSAQAASCKPGGRAIQQIA